MPAGRGILWKCCLSVSFIFGRRVIRFETKYCPEVRVRVGGGGGGGGNPVISNRYDGGGEVGCQTTITAKRWKHVILLATIRRHVWGDQLHSYSMDLTLSDLERSNFVTQLLGFISLQGAPDWPIWEVVSLLDVYNYAILACRHVAALARLPRATHRRKRLTTRRSYHIVTLTTLQHSSCSWNWPGWTEAI